MQRHVEDHEITQQLLNKLHPTQTLNIWDVRNLNRLK